MTQARIQLAIDGVATVVGGLRQVGDKVGDVTKSIGGLATLGGALSVGAMAAWVKSAIDSLDNLDGMAQKTGASVENLSKLQKVSVVFDQNFGEVDAALVKLAKGMAETNEESSKVQGALQAIGVSARDSAGALRDPAVVMVDIAQKLQGYRDGAAKTALINDLLGKSGANLLPYLNDLAENVDRFGSESTESAAQAAALKDQMGLMKLKSSELSGALAVELLPGMVEITKAMAEAAKEGGLLRTVWVGLGGLAAAIFTDEFASAPVKIANLTEELKELEEQQRQIEATPMVGIVGRLFSGDGKKRIAEIKSEIAGLQKSLQTAMQQPPATPDMPDAPPNPNADKPGKDKNTTQKISDYEKLSRAIREKSAAEQAEATVGSALSEAEKIRVKLFSDLESGTVKMAAAEVARVQADLFVLEVIGQTNEARKQSAEFQKEAIATANQAVKDALREAEANETLAATWGMSRVEIEAYDLSRLESQLAQRESLDLTEEETRALERQIVAKRRSVDALRQIETADAVKTAADKQAEENKRIEQDLTDSISDGIMNGFRDGTRIRDIFLREMQAQFAKTILRPGIEYVVSGGKSGGGGFLGDIIGGIAGIFGGSSSSVSSAAEIAAAGDIGVGLSFAGGGYTGDAPRSGGLDGKGGFLAMMHPQETVIDHTKGQSGGGGKTVQVTYAPVIQIDSRTDRADVYANVERMLQSSQAELRDRMEREGI